MIYCDGCSAEIDYDEADDEGRCSDCAPCGECEGMGCEECGKPMSLFDVCLNLAIFAWTKWARTDRYGFDGQKQFQITTIWIYGDRICVRFYNDYHDKGIYRQRPYVFLEFKRDEVKRIPMFFSYSDFESQMVSG